MIRSAEEFIALRDSDRKEKYDRSAHEAADIAIWWDIITRFPDYRRWVIHNKTVPLEILSELCKPEYALRHHVAAKRKLSSELFALLAQDADPMVRSAIAINKKTPILILNQLLQDQDEDVSRAAKYNLENR